MQHQAYRLVVLPGSMLQVLRNLHIASKEPVALPLDEVFSWDVTSPEHEDARGSLGGETRLEVVLVRAQRVTGRLVDEEGLPVADAPLEVSYTKSTVTTDAEGHERRHTSVEGHREQVVSREDGTFSFFRHLPFAVQVAPSRAGTLPEARVLEPLGDDAERGELDLGDLVLRKGRMLTGRVARADGGAAVEGARLEAVWRKGVGGSMGTERGFTDPDGTFRIDGILPGPEVTLTVRKEGFATKTLGPLPEGAAVRRDARSPFSVGLLFVRSRADLVRLFPAAAKAMGQPGALWIVWPKKASGVATDLDANTVREFGLTAGLVDYKIAAIDAVWSGLCFARRKAKA